MEQEQEHTFTPKQELFIHWYVKLLNGTQAARRAGYSGDDMTLDVMARDNLGNPRIKAEIDRRIKAGIVSADVLLNRISEQAIVDVTPYVDEDGKLDIGALSAAGLGHLVAGIEPSSNGVKISLVSTQAAQKMLARYHRLLGASVEIDQSTNIVADETALAALAEQLAAIQVGDGTQSDDAE